MDGFTSKENVSSFDSIGSIRFRSGVIRISTNATLGPRADIYLTVTLLIIGTIGNLLSIIAVTNRHSKKSSFTVFMLSLAIVDTFALYAINVEKLFSDSLKVTIKEHSAAACKLIGFFEQLIPDVSSWLIVCLTVERCLCTILPHIITTINSPKTGYIVVATILIILILLNLHLVIGFDLLPIPEIFDNSLAVLTGSRAYRCYPKDPIYQEFYFSHWNWITFSVYCLVPFVIIVTANTITVLQVYRSARFNRSSTMSNSSARTRQLLAITLLVSFTFVILGMPEPLMDIWNVEQKGAEIDEQLFALKGGVLWITFNYMRTINHAINFWLYVVSGKKFRQDLKAAFVQPCRRH